ncbi:glycoside hydrolase family 99-like domain-containing protein [Treponema bryantii]|uniref:glycosyltransferase WbsX family protein n=1 Tax=Treponema bryantii TaxID=163 RepID=UPI0003B5FBDF|nr:glycoside hydrolase family 99-like domain-containing protein [Treponema bryantii]
MAKPRILAFYLPQFHPIPENDEWWGKGFTEWTNVGKAKKYYPGHYQPRVPADLGYYDLRVPETREAQATLAKEAGIEGFCYWHYWFDNDKQLLERPFNEVLSTGKPSFPFCLAWANESWYAKLWDKDVRKDKLLIEQTYKGTEQYTKHFYDVLPAFKDERYIKVDGKPVFVIYKPLASPEISVFIRTWRKLAVENDLNGIFFIGHCISDRKNIEKYKKLDLDSINTCCITDFLRERFFINRLLSYIWVHLFKRPYIFDFSKASKFFFDNKIDSKNDICPSIITGWDHTPRSGRKGLVLKGETPLKFQNYARRVIENTKGPFIFIKSWNEWAEGNYIEPDLKYGKEYINALKDIIKK